VAERLARASSFRAARRVVKDFVAAKRQGDLVTLHGVG